MQAFETKTLSEKPDYLAPDRSEIRLLSAMTGGACATAPYTRKRPTDRNRVRSIHMTDLIDAVVKYREKIQTLHDD